MTTPVQHLGDIPSDCNWALDSLAGQLPGPRQVLQSHNTLSRLVQALDWSPVLSSPCCGAICLLCSPLGYQETSS